MKRRYGLPPGASREAIARVLQRLPVQRGSEPGRGSFSGGTEDAWEEEPPRFGAAAHSDADAGPDSSGTGLNPLQALLEALQSTAGAGGGTEGLRWQPGGDDESVRPPRRSFITVAAWTLGAALNNSSNQTERPLQQQARRELVHREAQLWDAEASPGPRSPARIPAVLVSAPQHLCRHPSLSCSPSRRRRFRLATTKSPR